MIAIVQFSNVSLHIFQLRECAFSSSTSHVNMLADPKEARADLTEVHFLPFNPVDKRTAISYIDSDGNWYRASKGTPEQILNLCQEKHEIARRVHAIIDKFAERGLRSLGVAYQGYYSMAKQPSNFEVLNQAINLNVMIVLSRRFSMLGPSIMGPTD